MKFVLVLKVVKNVCAGYVIDFNPIMDMNASGYVYAFSSQYKSYSVKVTIIPSIIPCKLEQNATRHDLPSLLHSV